MPPKYHCVHCMAPSESTYKQYSREIKLTTCDQCGQNVDPYVERDVVLVVMDCILLRDEAYRHVLCNRREQESLPSTHNTTTIWMTSALLQGYLLLQEHQSRLYTTGNNRTRKPPGLLFLTLLVQMLGIQQQPEIGDTAVPQWWMPPLFVVYSLAGNWMLIKGIQLGGSLLVAAGKNATTKQSSLLSLAFLLPTAFHIITTFIMTIWENTTAVRQLASLLVLYYQCLTAVVALQLQQQQQQQQQKSSKFGLFVVFLTGLIIRVVGLGLIRWFVSSEHNSTTDLTIPCLLGWNIADLLGDYVSDSMGQAFSSWTTTCLC